MFADWFQGLFANDMAIDLGTATTLIYVKGRGIVANEPSVVAIQKDHRATAAFCSGEEAEEILGRTPGSISAVRPMKDGVIADFEITEAMLRYFIKIVEAGGGSSPHDYLRSLWDHRGGKRRCGRVQRVQDT